ncbi:MAG: ABC transporter ATP-binding protein [Atopobiaceae bacterium]|nr:ABC transporter ATP-binding protein [Atopobiaceae bacterium]
MALLEVRDLHTSFFTDAGEVKAVNGVSFDLDRGKVLGIVGESGSGKSVTVYSIMQILAPAGRIVSGSIKFDGQELVGAGERVMRDIRGNKISIIFQDPMTSLNPTYTIGHQLMEAILLHTDRNKEQAWDRAVEMLKLVNVNEPEKRMKQYPHEFSGGMRQRVMIAMALACEPDILIADEPTTALDVTIQAQILELMQQLQRELGMAIIMITHDLGVVAQMCDEIVVMYAGAYCERGTADEIFYDPKHEYTKGLLRSIPTMGTMGQKLQPITGTPIDLLNLPKGCPFAPRCDAAMKICIRTAPDNMDITSTHKASCWKNIERLAARQGIEAMRAMREEGTGAYTAAMVGEAVETQALTNAIGRVESEAALRHDRLDAARAQAAQDIVESGEAKKSSDIFGDGALMHAEEAGKRVVSERGTTASGTEEGVE